MSHSPGRAGFDRPRWSIVEELPRRWHAEGRLPACAVVAGRAGRALGPLLFGRQTLAADSPPLREDAIFLVASITKPIVATGLLLLVDRGIVSLGDRVEEYLPGFGRNGKHSITLRHLLTHTSGLPDMLPNNRELREQNAPLAAFVEQTCEVKPDFSPGRGVQYQSMGFAVLGEVIQRVTGRACGDFLREEIFHPLGMRDTALGAPDAWFEGEHPTVARIAELRVPAEMEGGAHWDWNSRYWRQLGAPWGGLLTTPADLTLFARMMLNGGRLGRERLLSTAAHDAATRNQLLGMRDVPLEDRECRPWGLGWRLNWPAHSANFGDLLGPRTYGHWGATGTVLWVDPDRDLFAVILTTQPQEPHGALLAKLSNAIAAAAH